MVDDQTSRPEGVEDISSIQILDNRRASSK